MYTNFQHKHIKFHTNFLNNIAYSLKYPYSKSPHYDYSLNLDQVYKFSIQ